MGLYLGKDKISALRTIEKTTASMKAYLEAGGKCGYSTATTFEGLWKANDWENVTDMNHMFSSCNKLTIIPAMNTGNATNMSYMFSGCSALASIPNIDTRNVTDMNNMFEDCNKLTTIPAMNTGNATNMSYMFYYCSSITSIPLMNTSNATNMRSMFYDCSRITSVPALDASNATDLSYMFGYCLNIESIHMHGMKVSFDISASRKFTREALVEILNNLATVTTSKTLTMGSTNLAKLTDEDKAIATGKGWTLR